MTSATPDTAAPEPTDGGSGVSLFDLESAIVAGFLAEWRAEIQRAEGKTGAIELRVRSVIESGRVVNSRGTMAFERFRDYREASR